MFTDSNCGRIFHCEVYVNVKNYYSNELYLLLFTMKTDFFNQNKNNFLHLILILCQEYLSHNK